MSPPLAPGILLNRSSGDPLFEFLLREGYGPISYPLTTISFNSKLPSELEAIHSQDLAIDAWIISSPTSGHLVEGYFPSGCTIICTPASRRVLLHPEHYNLIVSDEPSSEGLIQAVRSFKPGGGKFLLFHGERSRQLIERTFANTEFQILTLISHTEIPNHHLGRPPQAGAYLALSPLQAELFYDKARGLFPIGWGKLLEKTFIAQRLVEYRVCDPTLLDLHTILSDIYRVPLNGSQI
ncbi:MAG: uroporphyrinogen-III synthase [Holophagaceae bacterium]|jgi:uroporphyrinogen-III synthase